MEGFRVSQVFHGFRFHEAGETEVALGVWGQGLRFRV